MTKEEKVVSSYILMNKLKDVVRTGWKDWNVERDRVESVAEHIYSTQQLALIMYLTYDEYKSLDINKILFMIAVHETEEAFIGDLTIFQISKEEKNKMGHEKVHEFFSRFIDGDEVEKLILEFDSRSTEEAMFAHQCDKLDCNIMAALYDKEECVDLNNQEDNKTYHNEKVQELLNSGMSFSEMWATFWDPAFKDDNFKKVNNYIKKIKAKIKE